MNQRLFFAIPLLVVGCAVGPDYERPTDDDLGMQATFASTRPTTRPVFVVDETTRWWTTFDDALLERLVEEALADNLDLTAAEARVREARLLRRSAQSGFFPTINGAASYTRTRSSENAGIGQAANNIPGIELEENLYSVGVDAAWELDVFGQVRRQVEAAEARTEATVEAARDLSLIVAAEVARNYADLRAAQGRLGVQRRNIELQAATLDLVNRKRQAGLVPEVDVARARTQLETTKAALPPLRAAEQSAAFRLSVLTGQSPSALLDELTVDQALPTLPPVPDAGVPADLIRRRPDLRQAERNLAASVADVGVATAELYPKFRISGLFALESVDSDNLFEAASRTWSIGPGVSVPLFNAGRLRALREVEQAQVDAAVASYNQAVFVAIEEVERGLVRRRESHAEAEQLDRALTEAERSVELSRVLYDRGLRDFQVVLDAQQALVDIEDRLTAARATALADAVTLYQALAGGWAATEAGAP
ncbi:MAG: efflux transporter outer membrane subunit [Planctomycetota bacterium]